MPEYVDAAVAEIRDSDRDEEVTLLLGVSGDRTAFANRVERLGASVDARLGHATLRVTATAATVDALCALDGLQSIELEREDVRVLDSGNGHSPRRLTRY